MGAGQNNFIGIGLGGLTPITITPDSHPTGLSLVTLTFSSAPDSVTLVDEEGTDKSGLLAGSGTSYNFTPDSAGAWTAGAVVSGSQVGSCQIRVGVEGYVALVSSDCTALNSANWITGGDGTKTDSDGNDWRVYGTGNATSLGPDGSTGIVLDLAAGGGAHSAVMLYSGDHGGDEDADQIWQYVVTINTLTTASVTIPNADGVYFIIADSVASQFGGNYAYEAIYYKSASNYDYATADVGATAGVNRALVSTSIPKTYRVQLRKRQGSYELYIEETVSTAFWDPSTIGTGSPYYCDVINRERSTSVKSSANAGLGGVDVYRIGGAKATVVRGRLLQR